MPLRVIDGWLCTGSGGNGSSASGTVSRRLYLPAVLVAGLAAWLAWRGRTALAGYGPAHPVRVGQFIAMAVLAIDSLGWLAHLGNHRVTKAAL